MIQPARAFEPCSFFFTGEWKGAAGPFRLMVAGLVVLIGACVILGYANSVPVPAGA